MMDLSEAASFFDDTEVTAPGSATVLFYAQLDLFADQLRDGLQIERRILSYSPSQVFTLPLDSIVSFGGRNWALGLSSPDVFQGDAIRSAYLAHLLDSVMTIGSAADCIGLTQRLQTYAGMVWMKNAKDGNGTEEYWSEVTAYTGSGVQIAEGEFFGVAGKLYRARNVYYVSSGIKAIDGVELPADAQRTVTWITQAGYDQIRQKPVPGVATDIPALVMRFYHDYRMVTQAAIKPSDGDLVARVLQTSGVSANDSIVIDGVTYRVVSRRAMNDATWWLHLTV